MTIVPIPNSTILSFRTMVVELQRKFMHGDVSLKTRMSPSFYEN